MRSAIVIILLAFFAQANANTPELTNEKDEVLHAKANETIELKQDNHEGLDGAAEESDDEETDGEENDEDENNEDDDATELDEESDDAENQNDEDENADSDDDNDGE